MDLPIAIARAMVLYAPLQAPQGSKSRVTILDDSDNDPSPRPDPTAGPDTRVISVGGRCVVACSLMLVGRTVSATLTLDVSVLSTSCL